MEADLSVLGSLVQGLKNMILSVDDERKVDSTDDGVSAQGTAQTMTKGN